MPAYSRSLFIFRRDLRLTDNTGLNEALRLSGQVIPCFIFDPEQIEPHPYQSRPGLRFMLQSLRDLELQLQQAGGRLILFEAAPDQVIEQLFDRHRIEAVFVNRDYTPFSRRRDQNLAHVCARLGISWHASPDALLNEPAQVVKNDNTPYRVFTAFYKRARQFPVAIPMVLADRNFSDADGDRVSLTSDQAPGELAGGRKQALDILDRMRCPALFPDLQPRVPAAEIRPRLPLYSALAAGTETDADRDDSTLGRARRRGRLSGPDRRSCKGSKDSQRAL